MKDDRIGDDVEKHAFFMLDMTLAFLAILMLVTGMGRVAFVWFICVLSLFVVSVDRALRLMVWWDERKTRKPAFVDDEL